MSSFEVLFFREDDGSVPTEEFLDGLPKLAKVKFWKLLGELRESGNELRRPKCDFLEDGIFELRARHIKTHYRLLYFFQGAQRVVVSHGCIKEWRVPPLEIERAKVRRSKFQRDPVKHSYLPRWFV